jgi:predicted protein tyrosine phosphatase
MIAPDRSVSVATAVSLLCAASLKYMGFITWKMLASQWPIRANSTERNNPPMKRPFQSKNILFVCAKNRLRSPTAEQVFSRLDGYEVSSAGVNSDADTVLTGEMVEEADIIFVMEQEHRRKLQQHFRRNLRKARVICLDIPDNYKFMDPELVALLQKKVTPHLR